MKKSPQYLIGMTTTALFALILSGCVPSSDPSPGDSTLVVDTSFQLVTADPARLIEPTAIMISEAVYETLLTLDSEDATTPVGLLAESYEVSSDGLSYTFTLRDGVTFADGTPLTAADVLFSFERVQNIQGSPSFLVEGMSFAAPDARTFVINLTAPNPAVPAIVTSPSLGVLNSAVVQSNGGQSGPGADQSDTAEASLNADSQGSGPYAITSFSTVDTVTLTRNDDYWGEEPAFSQIVIRNVDATVQKLNISAGESDLALDLSSDQIAGDTGLNVVTGASPNLIFLFSNDNPAISPISSSPDFQEAVRYGLDYEALTALAGKGAIQAAGVVPSMFAGALASDLAPERDVARAKEALGRMSADPTATLHYASDVVINGVSFNDMAISIQSSLAEVGITIKLDGQPLSVARESYIAGRDEMGMWAWTPDFPDAGNYQIFFPGNLIATRAGWPATASPLIADLASRAAVDTDPTTRQDLYQRAQEPMLKRSPFVPLIQPSQVLVANPDLRGVTANPVWLVDLKSLHF
ncbi:ABC transporter substrate-binding protein [Luethyella okanaganae]|uniref:ABC transporter substrate-binding protein n=1 Tax=Luethyella okanaganae TaxID=69372 RepID=A0ABW1VDV4_9MICO